MEEILMRSAGRITVKSLVMLAATLAFSSTIYSAVPNTDENPNTFLGPIGRVGVTAPINDETAFSLLGEAGPRNYRLGGTLGWQIDLYNRIKASAELLRQNITYSFFDGTRNPWVNQGALGVDYQYDFHQESPYNTLLSVSAYYSYAPNQDLGTGTGSYVDNTGTTQHYTVDRRIAGSNAAGISPTVTIVPWTGTSAALSLNYDNVRYNTLYSKADDRKGLGGTFSFDQAITDELGLGLSAAVRKPFTNYNANVYYNIDSSYGLWVLSLFGAYTYGKYPLPTTYNIGIGLNYVVDAVEETQVPVQTIPMPQYKDSPTPYKDKPVYKDAPMLALPMEWQYVEGANKEFLSWVSKPAVYMPQVLAVPDERVSLCVAPTFIGPDIGFQFAYIGDPFSFNTAPYFSGANLTYSFTITHVETPPTPDWLSINASTGVLSGIPDGVDFFTITVTATNSCGSATSNAFDIIYD